MPKDRFFAGNDVVYGSLACRLTFDFFGMKFGRKHSPSS